MAYPSEGLISSIKSAVKGGISSTKVSATKDEVTPIIKIIGKNFMTLPGIARDLNVTRQNMQKLVELEGGKPAKGADAFFLKEKERETKLEVEMTSKKPKKTAEVKEIAKKESKSAKDLATEREEPYVAILSMDVDPDNIHQGAFELDWNDKFVANLMRAGYQGKTDADVVDQWFQAVCRNVVLETWEQEQAMNGTRYTQTRNLGDGRTEVS